jgi:hypothetical protein
MDRETIRRLLLTRILERMAVLEDLLGPAAGDSGEYAYLMKMRGELEAG